MGVFRSAAAGMVVLGVVGVMGTSALGQVAPPPPPPPEKGPEYVPPEPRQIAPRERPQQPQTRQRPADNIPDVPYPPMGPKGEDGKIARVRSILDHTAMRNNPFVANNLLDDVMGVVQARRARFEEKVIENLDLVLSIDDGMVESLSITDPEQLSFIANSIRPITDQTSLTEELRQLRILSRVQAGMNQRIIQNYTQRVTAEIRETAGDTSHDEMLRFLIQEPLKEAMIAYDSMLLESQLRLEKVLEHAGLSGAADFSGVDRQIDAGLEAQMEQLREIKEAWEPLTVEQKQAFLRAVRETREHPEHPPVPVLQLEHEGQSRTDRTRVNVEGLRMRDHPDSERRQQE